VLLPYHGCHFITIIIKEYFLSAVQLKKLLEHFTEVTVGNVSRVQIHGIVVEFCPFPQYYQYSHYHHVILWSMIKFKLSLLFCWLYNEVTMSVCVELKTATAYSV